MTPEMGHKDVDKNSQGPDPSQDPTTIPTPTPNPKQKKEKKNQYMNFGRQKTRQQNLKTKYLNRKNNVKQHKELKLLTINVNSIHGTGKYDLAAMNIYESDPDIAIITETRLGNQSNTFRVSGYQIITQIDRRQGAGGLLIMAKEGVKVHSASSESVVDEIQVAKCQFKDLTIFGVYRSPTIDPQRTTKDHHASLINYLNSHINKLGNSRYIITGDFNLKEMAKHDFNPPGMKIADEEDTKNISPDQMWSDFYNKNGLEQYVKDPTYYSTIGGFSILDLVLAPMGTEITALVVDPERFGPEFDHNSVEFSVKMDFSTNKSLKLIRKPNKESWEKVRENLMNIQLNETVHKIAQTPRIPNQDEYPFHPMFLDIDESEYDPYELAEEEIADYLTETFAKIYKDATPEIVVEPSPPGGHYDHWTKKTIRHGKRFSKTLKWAAINGSWSEERLDEAREKLRIIRKSAKFMMKRDRITNEIRRLDTSERKNRNLFDHMKSFQKKQTTEGPIRDRNGDLKTEDDDMANAFNDNLGEQLTSGDKPNVDWGTTHPDGPTETLTGGYITPGDVIRQIKAANRSAAPGPDEIPMEFYAQTWDIIGEPISLLYNLINQTGRIPKAFKTTKVKMLYKKKAKDDPQNYRPLSMSNHLGKIWERIMNEALKKHLEKNGLLSSRQHGFRNGMGTTTNLMQLWEKVLATVEREGALVEMWSFDLTKAFDLLDHAKVLELLHKAGVTGKFGKCLENWLTGRYQYVEVNGVKSREVLVGKSCVQGSVLGPTLWLVYIQPLMDILTGMGAEIYGYADDIAIVKRIRTEQDQKEFEEILEALQKWAIDFGMRWSPAKTQRLVFKYQGCRPPHEPRTISFGGVNIEPMEATAESLGLLISSSCIFSAHLKRVHDKLKTLVYQIRRNFTNLTPEIQKKIYAIYFQSRIDYCSPIYNPGVEHLLKPIVKIVNTFWKLGSSRLPPKEFIGPQLRMIQTDLKLVHKMYKGESVLNFEDIFKTNRKFEKGLKTRHEEQKLMPIPKWRLQISRQKFSFRTRFYWNFLPLRIRELKPSLFKNELEKHLKANRQSYLNFSRNYNIIGEDEEDKKQNLLDQVKKKEKEKETLNVKRQKRLYGAAKLEASKNQKNPYLRKSSGSLTKITQNRLLLMGTPSIVDDGNKS